MDLAQRIAGLSPEQKELFELKLVKQGIDILQLPIYREDRTNSRYFPLSFGQERLWFIQQLEPDNVAYNLVRATKLTGNLKIDALERSIAEIVRRHEILRTRFIFDEEKPAQVVVTELSLHLQILDLQDLSAADQEKEINRQITLDSQYPFDLTKGPLLRTKLLALSEYEHIFLLVIHHIISDGTSLQVFIKELVQLYRAFSRGQESPLPSLSIQYVDFACWQRRWFGEDAPDIALRKKQETFWLNRFRGEIPVLVLPYDYSRPAVQGFVGDTALFCIDNAETRTLKQMALTGKTTLYVVLLTIYSIFLAKLSGMEDIIVGTPVAGRRHPDLRDLIGMFVNTLALRNYPRFEKTFAGLLQEVKENTINAFENQEYRYEDIIGKVKVSRDTGRNPLFDVMFMLKNVDYAEVSIPGLKLSICDYKRKTAMVDLTLSAWEEGETLRFSFEYCTKLFKETTIERFIGYFKQVVSSVINNPGLEIAGIDFLPAEEKRKILFDFNNTRVEYPGDKRVQQLFEDQAASTPDHAALVGAKHSTREEKENASPLQSAHLTYRHLNERCCQLARHLRNSGIKAGAVVGIFVDRSVDLVAALFAVLKSGAMYLSVDPTHPEKRVKYMLKASSAGVVLTNNRLLPADEFTLVDLNDEGNYNYDKANFEPTTKTRDPAYVIYTSGTTGLPKGVVIEHRALMNFTKGMTSLIDFGTDDTLLSLTTISFDIFGLETLVPLTCGTTVVIGNSEEQMDPAAAAAAIVREKVTIFQATPSRLQLFLSHEEASRQLKFLRYLLVGGEAFPGKLLQDVKPLLTGKLYNLYGPTETTIWSTAKDLSGEIPLNIGTPISNTGIYILDTYLKPRPIGVVGEIYIGGEGVARGYLNDPELTAERFVTAQATSFKPQAQAFSILYSQDGHKSHKSYKSYLYKTGDLGRWLPDGCIECLGRVDHQVKIRGFRIELAEIEDRLMSHKAVKEAVVIAKDDEADNRYLCAYYVTSPVKEGEEPDASELREFLSGELPYYMIPAYFVLLKSIPLTTAGKIDRQALPEPGVSTGEAYAPPRDELEEKLVEIWSAVLKVKQEKLGIDFNFFHLGGQSLKAAVMVTKVHKELDVKLPLAEVFKTPNIKGLSEYIKRKKREKFTAIEAVEKKEHYVLSSAQKRLYFLQQMDVDSTVYNIPILAPLALEEGVAAKNPAQKIRRLIDRHESLRTSFGIIDEGPVQKIHERCAVDFEIEYFDLEHSEEKTGAVSKAVEAIFRDFIRPFDLSYAPLTRVGIVITGDKYILMTDMHHIISDLISHDILVRDFMSLVKGEELPPLRIWYKDYAEWLNSDAVIKSIKSQEEYWLREYKGDIPLLNLPADFERTKEMRFEGSFVSFTIAGALTAEVKKITRQLEVTMMMFLFSLYNIMMARFAGQEELVVGTVAAGRQHADLENIIGFFVNMLPIKTYPHKDKTFSRYLLEVKEKAVAAYENQEYPFEELVSNLKIKREPGRHPLIDMVFVLRDEVNGAGANSAFNPLNVSHFDLMLHAAEAADSINIIFEYSTVLFKKETMERLLKFYLEILRQVVENKDVKLGDITSGHEFVTVKSNILQDDKHDFAF